MAEILYQGHASFRIITNSRLVIYVDPYAGEGYDVPADVLCVTHQHFDHYTKGLATLKPDCTVITNEEAYSNGEYNIWEINDIVIEAVPAYNSHHPKGTGVGYIMKFDGRTVYFPGDTGITEEMKEYADRHIDLMFVPCDGTYTMTLEEAKDCSFLVDPSFTVPIHTSVEKPFDMDVARAYEGKEKFIVRPGENIFT